MSEVTRTSQFHRIPTYNSSQLSVPFKDRISRAYIFIYVILYIAPVVWRNRLLLFFFSNSSFFFYASARPDDNRASVLNCISSILRIRCYTECLLLRMVVVTYIAMGTARNIFVGEGLWGNWVRSACAGSRAVKWVIEKMMSVLCLAVYQAFGWWPSFMAFKG